jgi:hypothetical protein
MMGHQAWGRTRPRLSRTFDRARWGEYRSFLVAALDGGYEVIALEDWVRRGFTGSERTLVLRHDVDQHPRSALRMLAIEEDLGVRATWYFRWRTAHLSVVDRILEAGAGVGLHYETLTRMALASGRTGADADSLVDRAREVLRSEIGAFARRFGPSRSVCPHGDSRIPAVRNGTLLRDQDCASYGIEFDGNEALRGHPLGYWLTDRSRAEGGWANRVSASDILHDGVSPVLCVVHPNNWVSGASLWGSRLLAAALPSPRFLPRPIRSAPDTPPDV